MKRFNVTGICVPEEDYMVDISGKISQIKKLVDNRSYFTINRARQYGKTTTLAGLEKVLSSDYIVISISFQGLGDEFFASSENFCSKMTHLISNSLRFSSASPEYKEKWSRCSVAGLSSLSERITNMCESEKVVLIIDEVDRTSNNRVFLHFIDMLRDKFSARKAGKDFTFHSVILAGVYDVKNIKLKMINEGLHTPTVEEGKIYNSPWNIAVNFDVDMSFSAAEIATMLNDYEADHNSGMDIVEISEEIYDCTSGYPFLVSRICQCIDEELNKNWTPDGIREAVKILLEEKNTLFDDIFKNIRNYKKLNEFLYEMLFIGRETAFNIDNEIINTGHMFGFLKNINGKTRISNKIFGMRIYNYYVSENEIEAENHQNITGITKYEVIRNGRLNMELCLQRFAQHYGEIFAKRDIKFLERHGRLLFLSYLKPLINGYGFYHVESEINDFRMDIVVDFNREQFIVELKIWRGEKYEQMAYEQLVNYLKIKDADTGYLLTFNFCKEANKERKAGWLDFDGKKIFEVTV
ncbi:MAG: GxxExxY protein [Oscillospiraceae bacterium]|nr:GxxExxY protein [Oscillospiraceae bacterium]